ncbi:amidohydrolase [Panacibacter ginsenosidivorans]|uniref:Amidohydrolase n=1 Tax=Panacibacter ginsenosidivorans TaxID=1813871 RepID=A0A5B8VFF1_9BACT|nr:amidohydrolase [Panacibacter ginsenosidivorans]QEC70029.1 amidohydrolase [Panacibacter ginsenosidivorans]
MKQAIILFLILPSFAHAQTNEAALNENVKAIMPKVVEWRRYFHQNPELSNREYKTGAFVADYLKSLGLEVKYPVAKTGVVAILKGGKPGPVIALRADMDALPVTERNNLPFKSVVTDTFNNQTVGVMHACGHDSHMAMLMGTATVLSKMKKDIQGTVVFLFQPAEEGAPAGEEAGAPLMVKEGVLDNPKVEAVFGLHIMTFVEAGTVAYKQGSIMASSDWFTITVNGKGSHGSQPWKAIDPIVTASQIIQGLQTIVSRQEDITKAPVVISVGSINSGNRPNIIPEKAVLTGTIRTLDNETRKDVFERIKRTAQSIAASQGATADVSVDEKTLVTFNDSLLVTRTLPALQAAAGKDNVKAINWITGSEDFSYFSTKAPAFFFFIGGSPKGTDLTKAPAHHTADFFIDESGFDVGVKAFCEIVFNYANSKKQ